MTLSDVCVAFCEALDVRSWPMLLMDAEELEEYRTDEFLSLLKLIRMPDLNEHARLSS